MFEFLDRGAAIVVDLLGLSLEDSIGKAIHFFIYDTLKIIIILSFMIFLISYIRSYFKTEKIRDLLSNRKGILGYVLAALLGIISPFCSCSTIPLFIGFVEAGIPLGITFTFLITSPLINEASIAILLATFGWKVTLIYVAAGVTIGIVGGFIIGKMNPKKFIEEYVFNVKSGESVGLTMTQKQRLLFAKDQVVDIVKKIGLFVLIGVGLGAFIHGWIPQDVLANYAGKGNPFAVIVAVLFGIPLYSGAIATIPVAEALIGKGVAMGTALAFMMAVTALSFPEFIILRKVMKPRLIALFALIVGCAIIIVGYGFNIFLTV